MRTLWLWSLLRLARDVMMLMVAALALAAGLALFQRDWTVAAIQGVLYVGSVLFVAGMALFGLQLFSTGVRRGATRTPSLWQQWYPWGPRALVAGVLVFLLGLGLQGTILGVWVDFPPPPF